MPASHHSLFLTPLRVLACLALLSVVAAGIAITVILSQSTNPMFSIRREVIVPDLSGMDWQQAQVEQSAAQLSIVWDTRYSAQAEGIVIAQKPTAGSTVNRAKTHTVRQQRAKHHHRTGSEKPEPFRCHPDPAGRRFYRFRRLYPQRSHPAGRYRYSAISCRRHRTGSRGLYYPYRCPCRTRPVPPGAVPAGHVDRRSAPPPCHCGAAAHSDPLHLTDGTITAPGSPRPGTLLHRNAHVRLVAK